MCAARPRPLLTKAAVGASAVLQTREPAFGPALPPVLAAARSPYAFCLLFPHNDYQGGLIPPMKTLRTREM